MKTSSKLKLFFWTAGLVSVMLDYTFLCLGFIFLFFLVGLVYEEDLDRSDPDLEKSWIFVVNRYDILRKRVAEYTDWNDARILQKESDKFRDMFVKHFKGKNVDEHMKITVQTSLTNRNEIECRAEAISEEGHRAIKLFNIHHSRAEKALNNK